MKGIKTHFENVKKKKKKTHIVVLECFKLDL